MQQHQVRDLQVTTDAHQRGQIVFAQPTGQKKANR